MEIVIENPVESPPPPLPPPSPPPPPPPPPPQPVASSAWNALVAASSANATSVASPTSMPASTTVMTITIAENPTAPTYPPVRFSYRESYAANPLLYAGDPYSARRNQPRSRPYDDPEGASPSARRVDKSGLLGITESDSGLRSSLRSPRFLSSVSSPGIASPRRLECVGQLDPVPEIPGQSTRANVAPGAAFPQASTTTSVPVVATSMLERRDARLDNRETLSVINLGRPTKSASYDSLEPRRNDRAEIATMQRFERDMDGHESSGYGSSFRYQEACDARGRTLGRLSRFALARSERGNDALEGVTRYSETCCNFPFTVRAPVAFPGFEEPSSLPSTRATTATVTTPTTTTTIAKSRDSDTGKGTEDEGGKSLTMGEQRAEAEGCEHGANRNPMKDGESPKRDDELLDNDAIQTLRVIILSEQL